MPRWVASVAAKCALLVVAASLISCTYFGPRSISTGRPDYNDAIHKTSAQQLLANIVRVHDQEMPLVMDVTAVNAAVIVQGMATSSLTGIGGFSALQGGGPPTPTTPSAALGGSFEYEENPTITYTPLSGQPLIAQLSTPITVDSLAALPDSAWPLPAVLELAVNYLTPNYEDLHYALNAILELDSYGALSESAARSTLSGQTSTSGGTPVQPARPLPALSQQTNGEPANDALVLYLHPQRAEANASDPSDDPREKILRLWVRLLRIYGPTQPAAKDAGETPSAAKGKKVGDAAKNDKGADAPAGQKPADRAREITLDELDAIGTCLDDYDAKKGAKCRDKEVDLNAYMEKQFAALPNSIELRTAPLKTCFTPLIAPKPPMKSDCDLSPMMRTRSALGVLKRATAWPKPLIEFVSPEIYQKIRNVPAKADNPESWNTADEWKQVPDFYLMNPLIFNCPVG